MKSELGLLEKFIQYCHSKQEGMSDSYITQVYNNMQELLLVQFLNEELQYQQSKVDELQKRVESSLIAFEKLKDEINELHGQCDLHLIKYLEEKAKLLEQALKGDS